jgi:hypothetical protein
MMATEGNFYSWLVGWVKIILPMLALALLSTLFLFARSPSETSGIPLAQLEELAREQQITAPQFSGVTDDGSVIAIAAKNAKPDAANPQNLLVENFSFDMDATDGTTLNITSGMSVLNSVTRTARLNGPASRRQVAIQWKLLASVQTCAPGKSYQMAPLRCARLLVNCLPVRCGFLYPAMEQVSRWCSHKAYACYTHLR